MKKLFPAILLILLLVGCSASNQYQLDCQKDFCFNVWDDQDKFINDNPKLSELEKESSLNLLKAAVSEEEKEQEEDDKK